MTAPYSTPYETTQGCVLYFANGLVSPHTVLSVATSMGLDNIGGDATELNLTNFSSPGFSEYAKGLVDPGSPGGDVVFQFNSAAQQALDEYWATGQGAVTQWYLGAADGSGPPTIVDGVLQPPVGMSNLSTRSGFYWYGFVKTWKKSAKVNDFIKATLNIRASGRTWQITKGLVLPYA